MTTWQALLLGLIQGITEFLPVSSSGHLALSQHLLGFDNLQDYILFDLVCHLGTLVAIFYFFFPVIKENFNIRSKQFWAIVLGTLPLFPLVLFLKPIKALFDEPLFLGPCFIFSSFLLFAGIYLRTPSFMQKREQWKDALIIGVFQAIAILPGISRSGATISAANFLGWQKQQAITFSFLLAIPAIIGGVTLEIWKIWSASAVIMPAIDPLTYLIGFLTSCIVGVLSLILLIRAATHNKWHYFAWYCLLLGIITTLYFNL